VPAVAEAEAGTAETAAEVRELPDAGALPHPFIPTAMPAMAAKTMILMHTFLFIISHPSFHKKKTFAEKDKEPHQNASLGDVRLHKGHLLVAVQADIQAGLLTPGNAFPAFPEVSSLRSRRTAPVTICESSVQYARFPTYSDEFVPDSHRLPFSPRLCTGTPEIIYIFMGSS